MLTSSHWIPLKCTGCLQFDLSSPTLITFFPTFWSIPISKVLTHQTVSPTMTASVCNYIPKSQNSLHLCNARFIQMYELILMQFYSKIYC